MQGLWAFLTATSTVLLLPSLAMGSIFESDSGEKNYYCQKMETFKEVTGQSISYFDKSDNTFFAQPLRQQLLRKSVAAFHGNLDPSLSEKEVNELGEDVYMTKVRDEDNNEYLEVSVGFGGGNTALYYYKPGTLEFYPAFSLDGECILQGSTRHFPIEKAAQTTHTRKAACTLSSGSAPFENVEISMNLIDDHAISEDFNVSLLNVKPLRPAMTITLPLADSQEGAGFLLYREQTKDYELVYHRNMIKASYRNKNWLINTKIDFYGSKATISGTAFPDVRGGFTSSEAFQFSGKMQCTADLKVRKLTHYRVIRY